METSETGSKRRDKRLEQIKKQQQIMIAVLGTIAVLLIVYWSGILDPVGFGIKRASTGAVSESAGLNNTVSGDEYEFKYMKPWTEVSRQELESLGEGFAEGVKRSDPNAFIGVKVKKTDQKLGNLKELVESMDEVMPTKLNSFQKTGSEIVDLGGREALKYSYTFDVDQGEKVAQSQFILADGANIYYVVFSSPASEVNRSRSEADKIVSSFKIK